MASTFYFQVAALVGDEMPATAVTLYESLDGLSGWAAVDSVALSALTLADDVYQWDSALADATKYAVILPKTALGVERPFDGAIIIPPAVDDPDSFTLFARAIDFGLHKVAGEILTVQAKTGQGVSSNSLVVKKTSAATDANGYVAIQVPADVGTLDVDFGPFNRIQIDSTGLGGSSVDLRSYA